MLCESNMLRFKLMYMGVIPFLFLLLSMIFMPDSLLPGLFKSWLLVVINFIAGSYWGIMLPSNKTKYIIISNVISIISWLSFGFLSFKFFIVICMLLLISMLYVDYCMFTNAIIELNYFKARIIVTSLVVCLLIIWLFAVNLN